MSPGVSLAERGGRGNAVRQTDRATLPVVVPGPEAARGESLVRCHHDDVHACVGEEREVGVYVVGVAFVHPELRNTTR